MIEFHIIRMRYTPGSIYGYMIIINPDNGMILWSGMTMEREWNNNKAGASAIMAGVYEVVLEWSPKFRRNLWEIKGTPWRKECKFHQVHFARNLEGCVGVGYGWRDIDHDDVDDLVQSPEALNDMHRALTGYSEATLFVHGRN